MTLSVNISLRPAANRAFTLNVQFESPHPRVVLFGPSGAGKSLTLEALCGLRRPAQGHIHLNKQVFFDSVTRTHVPPRDRGVGCLFQEGALFPHMSVVRNIAFGLAPTLPLRPSAAALRRAQTMMEAMDILPLAACLPHELSGGQRQRVALARALVKAPRLLLVDEPFTALDAHLRHQVRHTLHTTQQRLGLPMVLVSHDLQDVRYFADTLVLLRAGSSTHVAHRSPLVSSETLVKLAAASLNNPEKSNFAE
jgi:molybdate transport system ATP-binding protein